MHEHVANLRHATIRIEDGGAAGWIDVELAPGLRDREQAVHVLVHREATLGVVHGGRQHLGHGLRAVRLEHGQVRVDRTRYRERQMSLGARPRRDAIEPAPAEERGRRESRRRSLTAHREALALSSVVDERHALAAQCVGRGRLDHGGGEARRHRRVERVASGEQHAHAGHRHQRMARRDNTLGTRDHWPGRRPVRRVVLQLVDPSGRSAHGHPLAYSPSPTPLANSAHHTGQGPSNTRRLIRSSDLHAGATAGARQPRSERPERRAHAPGRWRRTPPWCCSPIHRAPRVRARDRDAPRARDRPG